MINDTYEIIYIAALLYMDDGYEPTSALKEAASEFGIPFGDEMGAFVTWARAKIDGAVV